MGQKFIYEKLKNLLTFLSKYIIDSHDPVEIHVLHHQLNFDQSFNLR